MKFGLTDHEFKILDQLCIQPLKKIQVEVWIFGSRARGDNNPTSDVDLLYRVRTPVRLGFTGKIEEDLIESRLPYKVDLVNVDSLAQSYRESAFKDRLKL